MIEIICDNCERTIEVDPALAGGKVACPACGDVNRVPEMARVKPEGEENGGAAAETQVAADDPSLPSPEAEEREICVVRPAMFRAHPFRYLLIVLVFLAGLVVAGAAGTERLWSWLFWPGLVLSLFAAGWWVWWWLAAHLWIRISISNKRTVRHEGIVRRHSTEVLHDHVRSVDIRQNFAQRLLKVGYIGIDSAGQDGIEIEIRDIPGPYEIKRIIDQYRKM